MWAFPEAVSPWPTSHHPGPGAGLVLGVGAGAAATAVVVAFRIASGPAGGAAEAEARAVAFVSIAAVAGAAAVAAATLTLGARGAGVSLVSMPVAVVTTVSGLVVLTHALGARVDAGVLLSVVVAATGFALVLAVAAAGVALLLEALGRVVVRTGARGSVGRLRTVVAVAVAVALTGAASCAVLADRQRLATATAAPPDLSPAPTATQPQASADDVGRPVQEQLAAVDRATRAVDTAPLTPQAQAAAIRSAVLPLVPAMRRSVDGSRSWRREGEKLSLRSRRESAGAGARSPAGPPSPRRRLGRGGPAG